MIAAVLIEAMGAELVAVGVAAELLMEFWARRQQRKVRRKRFVPIRLGGNRQGDLVGMQASRQRHHPFRANAGQLPGKFSGKSFFRRSDRAVVRLS
jgi:hypothetical protein